MPGAKPPGETPPPERPAKTRTRRARADRPVPDAAPPQEHGAPASAANDGRGTRARRQDAPKREGAPRPRAPRSEKADAATVAPPKARRLRPPEEGAEPKLRRLIRANVGAATPATTARFRSRVGRLRLCIPDAVERLLWFAALLFLGWLSSCR